MADTSTDVALNGLLVGSLAISCLLILLSMAMVGRKLADLDYQREAGINGTHRIQGVINVRTHAMRAVVGVTFVVFSVLLMAGAPEIWRMWVNRVLFVAVPLGYFAASVLDWKDECTQVRIELDDAAKGRATARTLATVAEQSRTAALQADRDSYKEMASEAIASLVFAADRYRASQGHDVTPPLASVVPEHQSPITPEQQATADRQTMRAQLTASKLDLGLPAREPAPAAESSVAPVDVQEISPQAAQAIASAINGHPPSPRGEP